MASLTGQEVLTLFSKFINDYWSSTTTAAGVSGGGTLVDTTLQRWESRDMLVDLFFRVIESGGPTQWAVRVGAEYEPTTGSVTLLPAFDATVGTGLDYEMHTYEPLKKFDALRRARYLAFPQVGQVVQDDTITGDGETRDFDIPSGIRVGPSMVFEEAEMRADGERDFLGSGALTEAASLWTATTLTHADYTRIPGDKLVPKHGDKAIKLTGTGTLDLAVANMDVTAAQVAGRRVTFGAWLWTETAASVSLRMVTDAGEHATTSTVHGGGGWEFLTLSLPVELTNATTFSLRVDVAVANDIVFINRAYGVFGDNLVQEYPTIIPIRGRLRDGDDAKVYLERAPFAGNNLRLVGADLLSDLGTVLATQVTASMEIDEASAELLFAKAARLLFEGEGITVDSMPDIFARINTVEARFQEMVEDWGFQQPRGGTFPGWWGKR